jgi:acyl-CoA thioesterase
MADETDMQKIFELFKKDRFAVENGMGLVKIEPGYAEAKMMIEQRHLNGYGTVMGGAIFTLADYAFAAAVNAKGFATVSNGAHISYFHPPRGAYLLAKASEVSGGRTLCTYNVDVFDGEGGLVARMTGNGFVKNQKSVQK